MFDLEQISSAKVPEIRTYVNYIIENIEEYVGDKRYVPVCQVLDKDSRKSVRDMAVRILKAVDKHEKEVERVKALYNYDREFLKYGYVAGVDEVGRGPLAGPIVSAAVVLDLNCDESQMLLGIKDSKQIKAAERERLAELIKKHAVSYSIKVIENDEIDAVGIGVCNQEIFKRAIRGLDVTPGFVLSDGYPIKEFEIKNAGIVKGDAHSATIACASIIAKVFRDRLMVDHSERYPEYGFESNVGYGSPKHIEALKEIGPCPIHRRTFIGNIVK